MPDLDGEDEVLDSWIKRCSTRGAENSIRIERRARQSCLMKKANLSESVNMRKRICRRERAKRETRTVGHSRSARQRVVRVAVWNFGGRRSRNATSPCRIRESKVKRFLGESVEADGVVDGSVIRPLVILLRRSAQLEDDETEGSC